MGGSFFGSDFYREANTANSLPLELICGLHNIEPHHRGNVATIGSFDGVHLGHQAVIRQVVAQAKRLKLPAMAVIFEPQPHEFFSGVKAPARLMRFRDKVIALKAAGVGRVFCLRFNHHLSHSSAREFIDKILVKGLGVKHLVIGDDFRFGCDREGDYDLLSTIGAQSGFTVASSETYCIDGERVSSTRIRQLLATGQFSLAATLLGHPYTISGKVARGQQIGRKLGFPTANVHLHRHRSPLEGVFAVTAALINAKSITKKLPGVANIGIRPTLGGDNKPLLEVHLLDRYDDIYGATINVEFKRKLRAEKHFENVEQLKSQIRLDLQATRDYFSLED